VEINSGNILYASSISTIHHTFTYVLSWTPEQNRRGNIRIIDCNGDTLNSGITTSGYTTISFPANGHHQFLFQEERWFYRNFYGWGWWGDIHPGRLLEVYIDDNKLNHPQNVIGHTYGLPNDFDLKFNGSICPNDYAVLSIGNVNWDNCNLPCFYDGDEAELSIIQGSEYVEFVDILSETLLGSSIHLSDYNNISNIGLKRKDDAPIVHDIQIIRVEGNINGVKDTSMIEYYPDEFVPSVDVYPEALTTGERINIDISYYSQCGPLPPETKINIEIINGAEYGNLIDPYTNEKIKTITNLDHWWGYAWVEFIADGNSTKQLDTITLRITTTDQAIMPNEALLIIKPPPIYVYTVPEVLGADDTADVIIQHRLEDGTLEDFPPDQTFELAVLDGCVNGNFMVGDSINVYFEDALQPIKFVTSDTLDSEVKNILIRVGTNLDEGGGGGISRPIGNLSGEEIKAVDTLRVGFEKMMAEKRAAAEKKENNEPPIEAPIVKQCALDEPTYTTYWKGFTSVGDECDIEECGDSYDDIQIEVVRQYNFYESGYFVVDSSGNTIVETKIDTVCFRKDSLNNVIPDSAMGQSRPLDYHRERKNQNGIYENAWHLKPCKNASGKIELRPVLADSITRTPIYIDFIADVCYTSITNDGLNLISDTTQLSDTTLVPDTVKIAKDICGHNCYPQLVSKNGFIIKEIVERHELLHMEHFKQILSDTKKDSLVNVLKKWVTYSCENYKRDKKQNSLDGSFDSELRAYISKAIRKYWLDHGHTLDAQGNPQIDKN